MASNVDETFPADNVKVSKADFRAQMLIIKTELEELQKKVTLPRKLASGEVAL